MRTALIFVLIIATACGNIIDTLKAVNELKKILEDQSLGYLKQLELSERLMRKQPVQVQHDVDALVSLVVVKMIKLHMATEDSIPEETKIVLEKIIDNYKVKGKDIFAKIGRTMSIVEATSLDTKLELMKLINIRDKLDAKFYDTIFDE